MTYLRQSVVVMLVAAAAERAESQVVVRVQSSGTPVYGAEVTVWNEKSQIAAVRTNVLGEGWVTLTDADSNAFVVVRRLGFAPTRATFTRRDTVTIEIAPVVALLPVLDIATKPLNCSAPSEPEAEGLWTSAAGMYSIRASELHFYYDGGWVEETVTREQRGFGDGDPLRYGHGYERARRVSAILLAEYERHINMTGEYWQWRYETLEGRGAEYFVSGSFLRDNKLTMLGRNQGAAVIGFCSRSDAKVRIDGELQIGPDALLRAARWFYRVPHDDEDAGGEASFARTAFEGQWFLVAVRGSSWRRAKDNLYNQRRRELTAWRFSRVGVP